MLRSDLCDQSDAYIVVKGDITLTKTANKNFVDVISRFLAFKNNAPFTDCILKIKWCINRQCRKFICCNLNVQLT